MVRSRSILITSNTTPPPGVHTRIDSLSSSGLHAIRMRRSIWKQRRGHASPEPSPQTRSARSGKEPVNPQALFNSCRVLLVTAWTPPERIEGVTSRTCMGGNDGLGPGVKFLGEVDHLAARHLEIFRPAAGRSHAPQRAGSADNAPYIPEMLRRLLCVHPFQHRLRALA